LKDEEKDKRGRRGVNFRRFFMATQPLISVANKQANSAQKNLFQNETYLKHISLMQPLEGDHDQALKRYIARCETLP
jgi:hypothetical protein